MNSYISLLKKSDGIVLIALLVFTSIAAFLSLYFGGTEQLSVSEGTDAFIFHHIRLPKTITAVLAGTTLSLAGLTLQIVFRNPLAGPYVLGVSSGASLFVAGGLLASTTLHWSMQLLGGKLFIVACAVCGSLMATLLILAIARKVAGNVILLLIGLMIAQICGALQMSLEYFADPYNLKTFVIWGMGSLGNTTLSDLQVYVPLAICFVFFLFLRLKPLTAMLYGENYSQNLGFNFRRERFLLILIASLMTGLTTAFCGPIAFVGIAVPIFSRMLFRSSDLWLHFFSSSLLGSILLLLSDALSSNVSDGLSLPINMITTLIGAPLVIYLMFKNRQW